MVIKMFYDAKQDPSTRCHQKLFLFLRFFSDSSAYSLFRKPPHVQPGFVGLLEQLPPRIQHHGSCLHLSECS